MQSLMSVLAAMSVMLVGIAAHATTYTYTTTDVPAATLGTEPHGITTTGTLAGSFRNGFGSGRHGFSLANGTVVTIDDPNAAVDGTSLTGINDPGLVAGNYDAAGISQAFLYANGNFSSIAPPGAANGTYVTGINNMGSIVGEYMDAGGVRHSFVTQGSDFVGISHPRALAGTTRATGINNVGWESGIYTDTKDGHGFLDVNGVYTTIDHPSARLIGTVVTAVNAAAATTGYYRDVKGMRGFVYAGDTFSPVDVPGALSTVPTGINDNGVVTGYFSDGSINHGFVATPVRTAVRAFDFTSNVGINAHIDYGDQATATLDTIVSALQYLKVRNVRDSPLSASLRSWGHVVQGAGVKFDAYIPSGSPANMQSALDLMPALANAGLLNSIEGPNEEDNPYPMSLGNSIPQAAKFQRSVYQAGKKLKLPVINLSFGSGWGPDNNWAGNYDKVGDLSNICDYANAHTFPAPGVSQPDMTMQMTIRNAHMAATQRPVIHTEVGWDYHTPDSDVPPVLLQAVFDAMQDGAAKVYLYTLFDEVGGQTFGLMNGDGSPKPEGAALHNLMTLLDDTGSGASSFTTGALPYSITATTGGDRTYLMQKSDGTYWLAVWNEVLQPHAVTIALGSSAASINVFNPVASATAVQTLNNANAVSFNLQGAPILIEITP